MGKERGYPKYAKTHTKIQVTASQPDGHHIATGNQQKPSVTEFCYKSENLSLEELKNIKMILFLI